MKGMIQSKVHGIIGVIGTVGSFTLANYSAVMSAIAATFTAAYMGLHFYREWRKVRSDTKKKQYENQTNPR